MTMMLFFLSLWMSHNKTVAHTGLTEQSSMKFCDCWQMDWQWLWRVANIFDKTVSDIIKLQAGVHWFKIKSKDCRETLRNLEKPCEHTDCCIPGIIQPLVGVLDQAFMNCHSSLSEDTCNLFEDNCQLSEDTRHLSDNTCHLYENIFHLSENTRGECRQS